MKRAERTGREIYNLGMREAGYPFDEIPAAVKDYWIAVGAYVEKRIREARGKTVGYVVVAHPVDHRGKPKGPTLSSLFDRPSPQQERLLREHSTRQFARVVLVPAKKRRR